MWAIGANRAALAAADLWNVALAVFINDRLARVAAHQLIVHQVIVAKPWCYDRRI
jgi:hypothetical protein